MKKEYNPEICDHCCKYFDESELNEEFRCATCVKKLDREWEEAKHECASAECRNILKVGEDYFCTQCDNELPF